MTARRNCTPLVLAFLLASAGSLAGQEHVVPASPTNDSRLEDLERELLLLRDRLRSIEERAPSESADPDPRTEETENPTESLETSLERLLGHLRLSGYVLGGYTYDRRTETSLRPLLADHHFIGSDASLYLRASLPADFNALVQVIFKPRPQDNVYRVDEDVEIERARFSGVQRHCSSSGSARS